MTIAIVIVSVLVGSAIWLWLLMRFDKFEPEPLRLVLLIALGAGLAGFFFAGLNNSIFHAFLGISFLDDAMPLPEALASALFVGINEELVKFSATVLMVFKLREMDEPIDAIIYATAAALGFATFENFAYTLEYGLPSLVIRLITAVPLHLGTAAIWGLGIAKARFIKGGGYFSASWGYLAVAAVIHAAYDFFIFVIPGRYMLASLGLSFAIAVALIVFMLRRLKHLQRQSPFAPGNVCPRCDGINAPDARFCAACGTAIVQEFFIVCETCSVKALKTDRFCAQCGARLPAESTHGYSSDRYVR